MPIAATVVVMLQRYVTLFRTGRMVRGVVIEARAGGAVLQVETGVGPDRTFIPQLRAAPGQAYPVLIGDMLSSLALVVVGRGELRRGSLLTVGSSWRRSPGRKNVELEMLSPIQCGGCGAPVPLAASRAVRCRHCGEEVAVPPTHVALFAQAAQGEAHLAQADAIWRTLPPPMPRWLPKAFVVVCVTGVMGLTVLWAVVGRKLLGGPGNSFVYLVMLLCWSASSSGSSCSPTARPMPAWCSTTARSAILGFRRCCAAASAAPRSRCGPIVWSRAAPTAASTTSSRRRSARRSSGRTALLARGARRSTTRSRPCACCARSVPSCAGSAGSVCAGVWLILAVALHGR